MVPPRSIRPRFPTPPRSWVCGERLCACVVLSAAASAKRSESRQAPHLVKVHKDKLTVTYNGKGNHNHDVGAVQSNRAFSHSVLNGYFEMTIVNQVSMRALHSARACALPVHARTALHARFAPTRPPALTAAPSTPFKSPSLLSSFPPRALTSSIPLPPALAYSCSWQTGRESEHGNRAGQRRFPKHAPSRLGAGFLWLSW